MTMSRTKFDGPAGDAARTVGLDGFILLKFSKGRADAFETPLTAQHFQRCKQRGRGLTSANRHPDRLKHLAGFDPQRGGCRPQRRLQGVMRKLSGAERLAS